MSDFLIDEELLAAIDMGSNSFHLAIARVDHGEVKKVASMSEKVQLAAGLDENKNLTEAAQQRGLACLARFVGRLSSVQANRLRIVATNALRQAKNGHVFIQKAAEILPKPIEIIAGREEARLIYLGVSHTMANGGRRLVIDIGGGSTEFIIGEEFEPLHTESLQMGCVAYSKAYFADGEISSKAFDKAVVAARKELLDDEVKLDLALTSDKPTCLAIVSLDANNSASYEFKIEGTATFDFSLDWLPDPSRATLKQRRLSIPPLLACVAH